MDGRTEEQFERLADGWMKKQTDSFIKNIKQNTVDYN